MSKLQSVSISLQNRDLTLLRGLFESRVMTAGHIAALYFDGKKEAAKKRLQKLKSVGFIGERSRRASELSVLFLTTKAFKLLKEQGTLSAYPALSLESLEKRARVSEQTLRHELEIMDVKAAFHSAIIKAEGFALTEFSTWPILYQFEAFRFGHIGAEVLVKPDGFVRIQEKEADGGLSEHTFFLEVDRSSETQETLIARAGSYLDYYKSGGFAVRNGALRSEYKEFPFRVIMVLKTIERRNNTAERLLQNNPPISTQVYLSTLEEVTTDPLGSIWIRPLDYRNAVKDTRFDTEQKRPTSGYKRETEREQLVEAKVQKQKLLAEDAKG